MRFTVAASWAGRSTPSAAAVRSAPDRVAKAAEVGQPRLRAGNRAETVALELDPAREIGLVREPVERLPGAHDDHGVCEIQREILAEPAVAERHRS
jgi:hypothetical protein